MTQTDPTLIQIDSKPFAITLEPGSSLANKTGSWRDKRPVYVHRLPPCNHACPAGENIQQWLYHAESGDYEAALSVEIARVEPNEIVAPESLFAAPGFARLMKETRVAAVTHRNGNVAAEEFAARGLAARAFNGRAAEESREVSTFE